MNLKEPYNISLSLHLFDTFFEKMVQYKKFKRLGNVINEGGQATIYQIGYNGNYLMKLMKNVVTSIVQ